MEILGVRCVLMWLLTATCVCSNHGVLLIRSSLVFVGHAVSIDTAERHLVSCPTFTTGRIEDLPHGGSAPALWSSPHSDFPQWLPHSE